MLKGILWMGVGAGSALWGRKKAIDEIDRRIPKRLQKVVKRDVYDRVKRFTDEVNDVERRHALERELEEIERRRQKGQKP